MLEPLQRTIYHVGNFGNFYAPLLSQGAESSVVTIPASNTESQQHYERINWSKY